MQAELGSGDTAHSHVFISHCTHDDEFVAQLRRQLQSLGIPVWTDSERLRGGNQLAPEIDAAIADARQVIAVLSPHTVNSPWVRREIKKALEVERQRKAQGYRIAALLLPGMKPAALAVWFDEEPVAITIPAGNGGLTAALAPILAALGEQAPRAGQTAQSPAPPALAELVLKLQDPQINTQGGKRRVAATATLEYQPPSVGARSVISKRFAFEAPLGPIEADDLRWYLERYYLWPVGVFRERAERIEQQLPRWGQDLYRSALDVVAAQPARVAWQSVAATSARRFSVEVDTEPLEGASDDARNRALEAGTCLFALPWELLRDERGWLFQGAQAVRVRRRLLSRHAEPARSIGLPIRILLVSPRPEDDAAGYIDHRISARPLVMALESLGELAELTVLPTPTLAGLEAALLKAARREQPFDVVHFDSHGVYDPKLGLGGLCFEHPDDLGQLENRRHELVDAERLAGMFREHRVPLVFLEACQSAKAEFDPSASVAAKLLDQGVASVVAMSHSVLVETARCFVEAFYKELTQGSRVGEAMLAGQRALYANPARGKIMGAGELHLQDWFVPVIYQEQQDPQLITQLPPDAVQQLRAKQRLRQLGALKPPPPHQFIGRSRELLAFERLLATEPWVSVRGVGGTGKTTLACELARWLVQTHRFEQAAFVSLEHARDDRAMVDALGQQLLPGDFSVASFPNLAEALHPIEAALAERATILVLDNFESVLPLRVGALPNTDATGDTCPPNSAAVRISADQAILTVCRRLLSASRKTRIVFTCREPLPAPFHKQRPQRELGALSRVDAIELVGQVLADQGKQPSPSDSGKTEREIEALVDAVHGHARALVLLAREVVRQGVTATTRDLGHVMQALERRNPGDRENSLYASVELSLRRLTAEQRRQVRVLGVCHGGVHMSVLEALPGLDSDKAKALATALIDVGLGEDMGQGHLRLDPALAPYLLRELSPTELAETRAKWVAAMRWLTGALYRQRSLDTALAAELALLELPNFLAMLERMQHEATPEILVDTADSVERQISHLSQPLALAWVSSLRASAASQLGEWNHSRYLHESANIERMLERGDNTGVLAAARSLLDRALRAGEQAYMDAPYDIAVTYFHLGRVLQMGGSAAEGLRTLQQARQRFDELARKGDASAQDMASNCISESGDCLRDLGRLDEAATVYNQAIARHTDKGRHRDLAVARFQLGIVRLKQQRFQAALEAFSEARVTFEQLHESRQVATAWHQIAMVHEHAGQLDLAEQAYRQSLKIEVQEQNRTGEAMTLGQLGVVCLRAGRFEESVVFYRQALAIFVELGDREKEGRTRGNIAGALIDIKGYDEARQELLQAIQCDAPFGHAAEPWKAWSQLHQVELTTGHAEAAAIARAKSLEAYLAYRREGGYPRTPSAELAQRVLQAIQAGATDELAQRLTQVGADPKAQNYLRALVPVLLAIVAGGRDPLLAQDPALDYDDAAEVALLLEQLGNA